MYIDKDTEGKKLWETYELAQQVATNTEKERQTEEGEWDLGNILRKVGRCGWISTAGLECADRPCLRKHLHLMHWTHTHTYTLSRTAVCLTMILMSNCLLLEPLPLPYYCINSRFPLTNMFKISSFNMFTQNIPQLIKVFALAVSSPLLDRLSSVHA